MKKLLIATLFTLGLVTVSFAQTAQYIIRASRDRISADTVSSRSRMVITAKDGTTTERLLDQYSSDSATGNRTVIIFQKPASVAGTRFLTLEKKGGDDDRWIYLPSLGKIRRIASSEGSGSFVGTDFSYDDISSADRSVEEDTHTLLRSETFNGASCSVIESVSIDQNYQYSKMISWIDSKTNVALKIELYDRKGKLSKILEVQKTQDVQGFLTPMVTKMTSVDAKTSTTIYVDIMKYNEKIPEGVFTTDYLSTGRVK
jgi:outer membrane lipoprotein-sorting protein